MTYVNGVLFLLHRIALDHGCPEFPTAKARMGLIHCLISRGWTPQ